MQSFYVYYVLPRQNRILTLFGAVELDRQWGVKKRAIKLIVGTFDQTLLTFWSCVSNSQANHMADFAYVNKKPKLS